MGRFFDTIVDVNYWYHSFTHIQDQISVYIEDLSSQLGIEGYPEEVDASTPESSFFIFGLVHMGSQVPLVLASPTMEAKPQPFEPPEIIKIWLIIKKVIC